MCAEGVAKLVISCRSEAVGEKEIVVAYLLMVRHTIEALRTGQSAPESQLLYFLQLAVCTSNCVFFVALHTRRKCGLDNLVA